MTIEQRVLRLERLLECGNRTKHYDNFDLFPDQGQANTLYVDKEESEIYIWNGTGYTLLNQEKRVCLNTAIPTFSPLDHKNPTISEVETYVTANNINTNGTQLVYFVDNKYLPQNDLGLYIEQDGETVLTSFIVNGDELITSPITIRDGGDNFVYSGELQPLFNAWLLANPNIQATFDDSLLEGDWSFYITNIIGGNLTISHVYYYLGGTLSESNTSPVNISEGDGGSCDNPDYIWTVNGSEVTLSNKRIFTSKTVYVDADSGSDVTGRRGYREFPFKTLNAAISATQTGDLLKVFPGDYTQSIPIATLFHIDCDNGVTWTIATGVRMFTATEFNVPFTVNWSFDKLLRVSVNQNNGLSSSAELNINLTVNTLDLKSNFYWNTYGVVSYYVKNNIDTEIGIENYQRSGPTKHTIVIENVTRQSRLLIGAETTNNSISNVHIKNLKSINSLSGYGNTPTIGYYFGSDVGINKQYTTIIDNVTHDDPNIYVTPPGPLATTSAWRGTPANTNAGLLISAGQSYRTGCTHNIIINNIRSTGHGVRIGAQSGTWDNVTIYVKIKGVFEKGIPIWVNQLNYYTNSKIIVDLDVECYTSMGLFIGFADGNHPENNIHPSNQVTVTGRIKTRYAGMSCISIAQGTNLAGNNTNGTILLKDLTLINDGTVSPIMCALPENVQIQNVVTNSLVIDPNILEVGQSIIRNTNYK